MQQSDALLISSLKQHIKVPEQISTLKDIKTEHIYTLACNTFQSLKIDYNELKQINKMQRFRSMTKLTQIINKEMDTSFDLNDIMNPNLPFLRKLLLGFVAKLGAAQGERNKGIIMQNVEGDQKKYQKQVLKRWANSEYICPQLRTNKKMKYQPHLLKIQLKKDVFKRDITAELLSLPGNSQAVLRNTLQKQAIQRKKRQDQQGITRKDHEQNQRNVHKIIKNNTQDWVKSQANIKKLKKQLLSREQTLNHNNNNNDGNGNDGKNTNMSVYQQQVSNILEQQKKLKNIDDGKSQTKASSQMQNLQEQDLDPFQKIKRQCENTRILLQAQLKKILSEITSAKQTIQHKQSLRQKLLDQIVLYQQRASTQKQARGAIKKQAQKQKMILDSLQGDTDINKEVQQLEEQVKYLQTEAEKQINGLSKEITNTRKEGEEKLEILRDLKIRLNKIQNDYTKVCEQIEDKNQIKGKIKITKSGISRLYYSKKISQMQVRWRETQKQIKKTLQNVAKIRQQIRRTIYLSQIGQTEIQNQINTSKFRTQPDNISFKDIFNDCKKTFQKTIKCIEQINETKNQIQEYQAKVHALAGKDYKQNIKKLEIAMEELKKQMKEAHHKK